MNKQQELLVYYCGQLRSEWARKKALAYLRILAEAEGDMEDAWKEPRRTAVRTETPPPHPALRSGS